MQILLLFIYSDDDSYNKMLQIQRSYCHKYENVHSFFVIHHQEQTNQVEVENDMVYVKGEETYLGITRKTVDALEYLLNQIQPIDYVVRSNISTVIHIPELLSFCASLPKRNVYTSGMMMDLQWLDPKSGIVDQSLWGTKYASGTSIVLSNDMAESIVKQKQDIRHDIVDDVSIGVFMTKYFPDAYGTAPSAKFVAVPFDLNISEFDKNGTFYRLRTGDSRTRDVQNMQTLCDALYGAKKEGFGVYINESIDTEIITYSGMVLGVFTVGYFLYYFANRFAKRK